MSEIIRVARTAGDFFQAYKPPFLNENLSFAARGLLAYLLTKPANWETRNSDLVRASPGGKAALQTILSELREAGHIRRVAKKSTNGDFCGWDTMVYERPEDNPDFGKEQEGSDIPISGKTEKWNDQIPDVPKTGMRKALIMSLTNNESLSNKGKSPQKPKSEKLTPADLEYYKPKAQAIIKLCKLAIPLVNGTKLDFLGVVRFLDARNEPAERVEAFGVWYEKTPNLKIITDQWGLFEAGDPPRWKQYQNGKGQNNERKQGNSQPAKKRSKYADVL